jgi:dienelactone hydrolase
LIELASHGYVVLANGTPGTPGSPGAGGKSTSAAMLTTAMNWVRDGKDKGKYGTIDKDRVVAAGQSCGGGQAMAVSGDPRVKLTGMFNSGGMGGQISKLNHPVMYLLGGKGDIAFSKVSHFQHNSVTTWIMSAN